MRNRDQMVLDAVGGRRPNMKGIVRANCPWCVLIVNKADRKQCLALNITNGYWKCYRCDTRGKIEDESMPHDFSTLAATIKPAEQKPVNLPDGFVPLWQREGREAFVCKPARKYLATRNIGEDVVRTARIGACVRGDFAGRIVVPIYKAGKLAGYVGRMWKRNCGPTDLKYRYNSGFDRASTLYNEEALYVTTDEPVLVVEGVFDTFPFWPNAVAVLGKPSGEQVEMLCKARRPIAVVLDGDAWREGEALAMALRRWEKAAVSLKLPPEIDPDEIPARVMQAARGAFAA